MMREREQEGCLAGADYLRVGWSRARSKLAGEGGVVQQGDLKQWWQSDAEKVQERDIEIRCAMMEDVWKKKKNTVQNHRTTMF